MACPAILAYHKSYLLSESVGFMIYEALEEYPKENFICRSLENF